MKAFPAKNKTLTAVLVILLIVCLTAVYFYFNVDMTGESYADITAYRDAHPNKNVTYTVTLEGDSAITLKSTDTTAVLSMSHIGGLLTQAEYLQGLTAIDFGNETMTAEQMCDVIAAFPNATVSCGAIEAFGTTYPLDTATVDLSDLTSDQVPEAGMLLNALPKLETVELCKGDAVSTVSLEDAAALHALCPDVFFDYRLELYEQILTTDMERVEYFKKDIGDEGLAQFELLMPMMPNLNYLKLDWCGTTDEVMAQMRESWAAKGVKIVWRIFFAFNYNALTDTYKIWANWDTVRDEACESLKYCNEVKYLDLGHSSITHCEFVRYMPDLEVCILSISPMMSIEPLRDCPKLWWVEFFWTYVDDLSPLEDLQNLEYLNISNAKATDLSPLYNLPKLKKLHVLVHKYSDEQIAEFREKQPDVDAVFRQSGDPTLVGWRRDNNGRNHPQYALLRARIGYDTEDYSRYPLGYVTEEITYESEGITPPD